MVTTLVAGAVAALFVLSYFGPAMGAGFSAGVLVGVLHLWSWSRLGRQLLGERDALVLGLLVLFKLIVVYGGTIAYLAIWTEQVVPYLIGFSLVFLVMIQKVLSRILLRSMGRDASSSDRIRSVS